MNLKKKTGFVALICCMAAIAAVVWYCLFTMGNSDAHIDGTFVVVPPRESAV